MIQTENFYWYGLAATVYMVTCLCFSAIRWFHTCRTPRERQAYIWPDRKLQCVIYTHATLLLPYILNPNSEAAWILEKTYFPATYYTYCGILLLCFFGTVKQYEKRVIVSRTAAAITAIIMSPLVINAWIPGGILTTEQTDILTKAAAATGIVMMFYSAYAMWQVHRWMNEARDDNYSNPDDFPIAYARRVWLAPIIFTPILWPALIFDSPDIMAWMNIIQAILNIVLLINVLPAWRRAAILTDAEEEEKECLSNEDQNEEPSVKEERLRQIAERIEVFIEKEKGYLNPHLRIEQVVNECGYNRTYVSAVFKERFGGFFNYVNRQRLNHYNEYVKLHPNITKEAAAQESGFTSYQSYYKVRERMKDKS